MVQHLQQSLRYFILLTVITGFLYPLVTFGLAQLFFPFQANGSVVSQGGHIVGSALIGQAFAQNIYFWGRPSHAGEGYDPTASGASNWDANNADFLKDVASRIEALRGDAAMRLVPVDLVTSSASGLDPDISLAGARFQAARVAAARHLSLTQVEDLIAAATHGPDLGLFGETRVNVLQLNRSLDEVAAPVP